MCIWYVHWDTTAFMCQHGECRKSHSSVWQKKTVMPNSGWALGDRCCTLQVSKDFIILKINVKITEKLSSVLLLNLEILQHQVFTPFVREIKLAAPFYIPTYKVKNSDETFQTYELNVEHGTLFFSTFPTKHKRNWPWDSPLWMVTRKK